MTMLPALQKMAFLLLLLHWFSFFFIRTNSVIDSREYSTKLPANGEVVFIGRPGDLFGIDIR